MIMELLECGQAGFPHYTIPESEVVPVIAVSLVVHVEIKREAL